VNMGVAIAVNDGVVAVVIPNAHTASLAKLHSSAVRWPSARGQGNCARRHRRRYVYHQQLGMYQVDQFTAIIMPRKRPSSR